jgi:C4-dicarboxylate-specific signal transduction histidine kinase
LLAELLVLLREQHSQMDRRGKTTLAGRRTGLAAEYGVEAMLGRHFDARNIQVDERHLLSFFGSVTGFAQWGVGERIALEDMSVRDAIGRTDALLVRATVEKGVIYDPDPRGIAPGLAVRVVPALLAQILPQLLMNVVGFLRPLDSMFVRVMAVGERVWIRVTDAGAAVIEHDLGAIVPLIVRPRDDYLDAGVALWSAEIRALARAMGGELTATHAKNNSSSFTLVLPRGRVQRNAV